MKRPHTSLARKLRKDQTDAERMLWTKLRDRRFQGAKFRRQFPIGRFVIDFYMPEHRLGIEVDGGHHYSDESEQADASRSKELRALGVRIIRFSNQDVFSNMDGICERIRRRIQPPLTLTLSPEGRGKRVP